MCDFPLCLPKEDRCYIDDCYDPTDSFEISLFDKFDACCTYGYDAPMEQHPRHNKNKNKLPNTFLLLFMIYSMVINLMILLYQCLLLIFMVMRSFFLDNLYDSALDDGPMLFDDVNYTRTENGIGVISTLSRRSPIPFESDQSFCYNIVKSRFGEVMILYSVSPTILESDHKNYVLVGNDKHALCDSYFIECCS